jgi:cation diffusion facilitator family transporter
MLAVNLGLTANVFLAVIKTIIGVLGHSSALLADGINSTSDVAYYGIVRVFIKLARQPADEEHPYGHRQLESISAVVVGAFVLTTALAIFWDAVNRIYDLWTHQSDMVGVSWWALVAALMTVGLKIFLFIYTRLIGRQLKNPAVTALAYDHRNDIFAASAATIGILVTRLGLPWMDPLAGAVVALVIFRTGMHILSEASKDLMDTIPGGELNEQVRAVLADVPGIAAVEEVLAHRFGPYLVINITIAVKGSLSVAEGDRIATLAERTLTGHVQMLQRVHVHYHPVGA